MTMTRRLVRPAAMALTLCVASPSAAMQDSAAPPPPAPPTEIEHVQATVDKWVGDFNRGDFPAFVAACDKSAAIIDGFPPYAWTGCSDWIAAYQANNRALSATHGTLTIGKPAYSEVGFDRAYIIYPATFANTQKGADTQKGKPVTYQGSWTITLRKMLDGWTITGSGSAWGDNSLGKPATP